MHRGGEGGESRVVRSGKRFAGGRKAGTLKSRDHQVRTGQGDPTKDWKKGPPHFLACLGTAVSEGGTTALVGGGRRGLKEVGGEEKERADGKRARAMDEGSIL